VEHHQYIGEVAERAQCYLDIHGSTASRYPKPKDSDSTVIRSAVITDVTSKKQKDIKKDSAANIEDSDITESEQAMTSQ